MTTLPITHLLWNDLPDGWQDLVRECFHPAYIGICEAYAEIEEVEGKIGLMHGYGLEDELHAWAIYAEGRLVGLATGKLSGQRFLLYDLFVSPTMRRMGLARRLVQAAMQTFDVDEVTAEVNRDNAASQALFQSLGFRCVRASDWYVFHRNES